jgi:hypothetical protein
LATYDDRAAARGIAGDTCERGGDRIAHDREGAQRFGTGGEKPEEAYEGERREQVGDRTRAP